MRRGTKKCILLLLAILLLCLLAWRLTPHTFEEMTASDRDEITSLAGVVSLSGVRDGRAYTESYALQNVTPEDTAFEGVLMLLNSTRYREDFRNLLPWPIESVSAGEPTTAGAFRSCWSGGHPKTSAAASAFPAGRSSSAGRITTAS